VTTARPREGWRPVTVVELDDEGRKLLTRRHPAMAGCEVALVVACSPGAAATVRDAMQQMAALSGDVGAGEELPVPTRLEEIRREAAFRARVLRDYGGHSARKVAELSGSTASNRSQAAYRWRKEGRIFAVPVQGELRYLDFQFDDEGRPWPVIAEVLAVFAPSSWPAWQVAAWFVTANGLLGRSQPVHLLRDRPGDVVEAARIDARRS